MIITRGQFQAAIQAGIDSVEGVDHELDIEAIRVVGMTAKTTGIGSFASCPVAMAHPQVEYPSGIEGALQFADAFDSAIPYAGEAPTIENIYTAAIEG
jgi:hypothetical protein